PVRDYFGHAFWQTDELGQGRAFYRPLTILSLAIDHELYGDGAGGYHLSNLLLHLLSTVLLFRLLRVRGASSHAATLGAALWSLHPRLTEAVAWISGRTDVLATFFVLGALLVQARPTLLRRLACALLLFFGLLCKEVALAGVAAVLVLELGTTGSWSARARRALPTLLAFVAYSILRVHASGIASARSVPLGTLLLRATAALGQYFVMFLVPWWPNTQIGQLSTPRTGYAVLGCALLLGLCALLIRARKRLRPESWSALTLGGVGLGVVLHVVPFSINVVAADRFLYLPLVGLALLLTPAAVALEGAKIKVLACACALVSLSFAVATFERAKAWADELELWTKTYRDNPENEFLACAQLGRLYVHARLFSYALSLYQGCSAVTPVRRFVLLNNGASVLARTGRYREALTLLNGLDEVAQRTPLVALNQALFSTYLNDFAGARAALARALLADPKSERGLLFQQQLPALERARQQLDALPNDTPAVERARQLQSLGLTAEAVRTWQSALASGALASAQFREGVEFVLEQADAATVEALHRDYSTYFAQPANASLEAAYSEQRRSSQRLLSAWPSLGLPLLALSARVGS
ncbi:MAG: hypothetical protein ABW061_19430, partial [Polyangiaceae bacterium]